MNLPFKLPVRFEIGGYLVAADAELITSMPDATTAEMEAIVALMNQGYKAPKPEPETMQIQVCNACGSANVVIDAFVHVNEPDDVRTFDDRYCENCECSCKTHEVTVPRDFDIYSDIYKEGE